jgi:hypothetical protein
MVTLEAAIKDLRAVLHTDVTAQEWRWRARRRLSAVRDALAETPSDPEGWLSPRAGATDRERRQLRSRVAALAAGLLDRLDTEAVVVEVARLQRDLEHHLQRCHDLAYDAVGMEIGGSE